MTRNSKAALILLLAMLGFAMLPQATRAHAVLVSADPAPDAVLETPPEQIMLVFNERLETGLYYIHVLNANGKKIPGSQAQLSEDRKSVSLQLPRLAEGSYTVAYRVVSADGHPVSSAYVFHVGEAPTPSTDAGPSHDHQHAHHPYHDGSLQISTENIAEWTLRAWYYASLLMLAGWLLWGRRMSPERDRKWLTFIRRSFLLSLLLLMAAQLMRLTADDGFGELASLPSTSLGQFWIAQLCLAMLVFAAAQKARITDIALAGALLLAEAFSGHAAGAEPAWAAIALDYIHLLMAALWAGGLLILLAAWRKERAQADTFLRTFSRFAWISMILLVATGVWTVSLLLPGWNYLFYSAWGTLMIAKTAVVLAVAAVALSIRWNMRRHAFSAKHPLLKIDFALALLIIIIVGVMTVLAPVPANTPLHWHVMGEEIHMTAEIRPNAPGHNEFKVKVWLPEDLDAPKQVQLQLVPLRNGEDKTPISVPLAPDRDETEKDFFLGFERYDYSAEGFYLAFPGKWEVIVRVTDPGDEEHVFRHEMTVY